MPTDIPEKIAFFLKMLESSQLTISDISEITSISRNTLYRWRNGKPASDRIRVNAAYITAQRMERAIKAGRLPLRAHFPNKIERLTVLKRIIRESAPPQAS